MIWKGVFPAVTTPFTPDLAVDRAFLAGHLERLLVHRIKLVQQAVALGSERLRPPRLALVGAERAAVLKVIRESLAKRPNMA